MPPRKRKTKLPDAMPDVDVPTLLVVCDSHQCKLIDVGRHTLLVSEEIHSKENTFTDHEGRYQSPAAGGRGGIMGGTGDLNPLEKNRLREFANVVAEHVKHVVDQQGIEEWYLSAPDKFMPVLKKDLSAPLTKKLKGAIIGNFYKESPPDLLVRFKPEMKEAMKRLKDEENYSPSKHLPKRSK